MRIVLVGDSGVGKTSILRRYIEDKFSDSVGETLGIDALVRKISYLGRRIKTLVWDTSGHERFHAINSVTYAKANVFVAVFDLTRPETLENLSGWIKRIREHNQTAKIILVGSKSDLVSQRAVAEGDIEKFIARFNHKISSYLETSSKTGKNNRQLIERAVQAVDPRHELIEKLQKYINRFKTAEEFSFFRFPFYSTSRAISRRGDVLLAENLIKQLSEQHDSIDSIFSDLNEKRISLIKAKGLAGKGYVERGINSATFNKVITLARELPKKNKNNNIENNLFPL
jgi:small GTP-binding protein